MLKDRIATIVKITFPILVLLAFSLLALESYKYGGFLSKYILVGPRGIVVIISVLAFFVSKKRLNTVSVLIFKINDLLLLISSVLYLSMQFLEATNFRNYVFSTYHIQSGNFLYIVILSFILFMVPHLVNQKSLLAIFFIFIVIFYGTALQTVDVATYGDMYILSHLKASNDFKMNKLLGVYYDYTKFVKANTSVDAKILVPPMACPWCLSGNLGTDRYFLFPRNMENGTVDSPIDSSKYEYVFLVWGEWGEGKMSDFGWPKVPIKAEKIIYFDPATGATWEKLGNFDPKTSPINGVWGLIKI